MSLFCWNLFAQKSCLHIGCPDNNTGTFFCQNNGCSMYSHNPHSHRKATYTRVRTSNSDTASSNHSADHNTGIYKDHIYHLHTRSCHHSLFHISGLCTRYYDSQSSSLSHKVHNQSNNSRNKSPPSSLSICHNYGHHMHMANSIHTRSLRYKDSSRCCRCNSHIRNLEFHSHNHRNLHLHSRNPQSRTLQNPVHHTFKRCPVFCICSFLKVNKVLIISFINNISHCTMCNMSIYSMDILIYLM